MIVRHCILIALVFSAVTSYAQDRYPRPGEPGAISAPPAKAGQQRPVTRQPAPNPLAADARPTQQQEQSTRLPQVATARSPIEKLEQHDFGVRAPTQLHAGAMHGPTPTQIPGGTVISTAELKNAMQRSDGTTFVFHVLGQPPALPGALFAAQASNPGSFNDQTQQQLGQYLQQITRGNQNATLVFYCSGPQCWMSYNAALRAIRLGYRSVRWYRGGLRAWQMAGLPVQ